ncbi:(Fe-S)-binding protein [Schaalia sp. Marseille-Q2122]|uniref:(Fe-S)-binding protein n=1 Tax=Schaalia sp. Marseille-Q2122 TaxID=2736604 RepID=UPI00158E137A|nr:(Fe-S)-binding protein [Schaalia sp. Marseille-Q2122]
MASPLLITVCWVFALLCTAIALLSFGRGLAHLARQMRAGAADHTRTNRPWRRAWGVLSAALTHREFKGRPLVKIAHWVVMVSFPVLFLTLITGYAHLRDQSWALPLIGHFPPWLWLVEFFAWAGFLGIIALMVVRRRAGRGSRAEAALSGDLPDGDPDEAAVETLRARRPRPRDGSAQGLASRFLGSTHWQALFVEWVILLVCGAVIALRALEYAHTLLSVAQVPVSIAGPAAVAHFAGTDGLEWWRFPLTWWMGYPLALWLAGGAAVGGGAVSGAAATGGEAVLGGPAHAAANLIVLVSTFKIIVSMLWLTVVGVQTSMGVAWHRFLAVLNLYFRRNADGTKSLGPAAPMLVNGQPMVDLDALDALTEDEDAEVILGVGTAEDLTWKARLDLYSCTECGRCQELCPAWNTEKPLSPKLLVLSLRDHVHSISSLEISEREVTDAEVPGSRGVADLAEDEMLLEKGMEPSPHSFDLLTALSASGATGPAGVADVAAPLVPDVIDEGVLWDCTTCGACVEQCPVDIEHVDHILDLRRHQVLMESAFPRELSRAFRGMESKGNPYNQPARKRMEWAKNLDFDVPVVGEDIEDASEVDYLFWVGCAGAYDDKAKATTAAVAELLHTAGVSFAVLGSGESCTGDPARRAGNEVLFQMLASAAIEALTDAKAQRIVVTCAHCFNTIAGEFTQLGARFEVIHHTQLLNRLVREGLLTPVAPGAERTAAGAGKHAAVDGGTGSVVAAGAEAADGAESLDKTPAPTITYHDPCYLGRHNRVYEAPRELLGALGVNLVEMPRNRERALCCGAGGARAWMEETRGIRIADARMVEAASTGADIVATACPFCSQMLGSATGASAGFTSSGASAASSAGDGAAGDGAAGDGARASLPQVRDVAIMMLEAVRRGKQLEQD